MSKDPAFLFYPGDYLRDTQCLHEKPQVAYDRIMCEHMRNIMITKQRLDFFTKRLNEEELSDLMSVLIEEKGLYYIEWVKVSLEKRIAYSDSRRKNRAPKPQKTHVKTSEHMVNEIENENEKALMNGRWPNLNKTKPARGFEIDNREHDEKLAQWKRDQEEELSKK